MRHDYDAQDALSARAPEDTARPGAITSTSTSTKRHIKNNAAGIYERIKSETGIESAKDNASEHEVQRRCF
jgi:hypothetical protein